MKKKIITISLIVIFVFFCISFTQAARLDPVGEPGAITLKSGEIATAEAMGVFIKIGITVVGAVALGFFVYGGITWVSSMGNTNKISQGKQVLVWASIGLIIVLFAYPLTDFIIFALTGGYTPADRDPFGPAQCGDGRDNDCDGLVDVGEDPGCVGINDDDESNPPPADTCDGSCYAKSPTIQKCEDLPRDPTQQKLIEGTGECVRTALEACSSGGGIDPATGDCLPTSMSCTKDDYLCCKEPPPPPICGGSANLPSGTGTEIKTIDMYVHEGKLGIARDFRRVPDKLSLFCEGESKPFFTTEYRQCRDTHIVEFNCPSTTKIVIKVESKDPHNTVWCFNLVCDPTGPIINNCPDATGICPITDENCPASRSIYCPSHSSAWVPPACPADPDIQCDPPPASP